MFLVSQNVVCNARSFYSSAIPPLGYDSLKNTVASRFCYFTCCDYTPFIMFDAWDGFVDNISCDARSCNVVERMCNKPADYALCGF